MNGFYTMIKTNIKLLLRNKGYLAFLVILPIVSVIMLNINIGDAMYNQETTAIKEMKSENMEILNMANDRLSVMVYDCSNSDLSDYMIQELAKTGSFSINRYRGSALTMNEARDKALYISNHNAVGAVIYFPDNYERMLLEGEGSNMIVFRAIKDGRIELLERNLSSYQQSIDTFAALTNYDIEAMKSLIKTSTDQEMVKSSVSIEVGDVLNLSTKQKGQSCIIGYSLSFLTVAFLFSGVFIAGTVVEERQNRVYNRIVLSTSSLIKYGISKALMILVTVFIQTGIIAAGIKLLVKADYGISFLDYLILVFCLGLIFNLFSVVIGVVTNNVLTSNYIAFLFWCISSLLAGLYFPLNGASDWWERVSLLMPQRWVVKSAEMLMVGKSDAYSMFLFVVLSYVVVIMSVGLMGIRVRRKE